MKSYAALLLTASLCAQTQTGGLTPKGAVDASGATATTPAQTGTSLPGTCTVGQVYFKTDATATSVLYSCTTTNTWTPQGGPHVVTFVFNGGTSVLTTGTSGLYPGNGALKGTINRVDISGGGTAGATCSITIDIWKANAAIPTSGGKISASAPVTLSTANLAQSMDISTWTKAVAANDVWGASVATVTGCITALVQVWYQ